MSFQTSSTIFLVYRVIFTGILDASFSTKIARLDGELHKASCMNFSPS